jgi:hypothetical protein
MDEFETNAAGIIAANVLDSGVDMDKLSKFSEILAEESANMAAIVFCRLLDEGFEEAECVALMTTFFNNSPDITQSMTEMVDEVIAKDKEGNNE